MRCEAFDPIAVSQDFCKRYDAEWAGVDAYKSINANPAKRLRPIALCGLSA
jgi:hypothetical protein